MERNERIRELSQKVNQIVGFGAVSELGWTLNKEEADVIVEYSVLRGGNEEYLKDNIKEGSRRPFDSADFTFQRKCRLCETLVNYCCC
jgi:hypothetical protein